MLTCDVYCIYACKIRAAPKPAASERAVPRVLTRAGARRRGSGAVTDPGRKLVRE